MPDQEIGCHPERDRINGMSRPANVDVHPSSGPPSTSRERTAGTFNRPQPGPDTSTIRLRTPTTSTQPACALSDVNNQRNPAPSPAMACADCFPGHVHEDTPRGTSIKLHGLDTYVSEPTGGRPVKGIVVIIPDAFGWEFVNNRILADHYADKGDFKVYLPDFMAGEHLQPDSTAPRPNLF